MSWHFVERWLQKVNQHSTLIGKFWITFLIVFRIVVVSSVGDRVYSDEQSEFKCNSMQVGCPNLCFNKFSPISHIRFWSFQIIMVTTPSIVFMVYSAHQLYSSKRKMRKRKEKSNFGFYKLVEMFGEEKAAFSQHYVLYTSSVLMRTLVEILFIVLQYRLFGFRVSELYKCTGDPCPNIVDCFVSRPMEKTIFLWFMFVIAVICLALNVGEMYYLLWQFGVRRSRLERKRKRYRRSTISEVRGANLADAEILDGGVFPVPGAPP
uniref:Gap junction protein n=1 Tax=Ciona intestinalis TaxID=7719 RepID=F6T0Z3_CIOIN